MHPRTRQQPALPDFHSVGEPALPRVHAIAIIWGTRSTTSIFPGQHRQLVIVAESLVEHAAAGADSASSLAPDAWNELDALVAAGRLLGDAAAQRVREADAGAAMRWRRSWTCGGATIR